jgi:hypothetical protein
VDTDTDPDTDSETDPETDPDSVGSGHGGGVLEKGHVVMVLLTTTVTTLGSAATNPESRVEAATRD